MDNWQRLLEQFGVPFVVLVAFGWFFLKHLWPFLQKQIQDTNAALTTQVKEEREARREALTEFMKALERRDVQSEKVADALDALTDRIKDQDRKHSKEDN